MSLVYYYYKMILKLKIKYMETMCNKGIQVSSLALDCPRLSNLYFVNDVLFERLEIEAKLLAKALWKLCGLSRLKVILDKSHIMASKSVSKTLASDQY